MTFAIYDPLQSSNMFVEIILTFRKKRERFSMKFSNFEAE
jgi:hypothetical protein